ncbi:interleukin-21 receptor [Protopterus annectens]|uniref:interleukin-21 receptor n=1 Tax=Protopterus annectens TaxID=7888 RepID=UPI001CFC1FA5|nr:interleukin-21 receptor [Protopterus annectens]
MKSPERHMVLLILFLSFIHNTICYKNVTCITDYTQNFPLNCTFETDHSATTGVSYKLTASWFNDEFEPYNQTCDLILFNNKHSVAEYWCSIDLEYIDYSYRVNITVLKYSAGKLEVYEECNTFILKDNIKPQPPFNLEVNFSAGYNISWKMIYTSDVNYFLHEELQYEVRYKRKDESWTNGKKKSISADFRNIILQQSELSFGTEYILKVRAKPREGTTYHGFWSEWSPAVSWWTNQEADEGASQNRAWLLFLVLPLLAILVLGTISFHLPKRLWKKLWDYTPDPSHFFKPLYVVYNGDFKNWVGNTHCDVTTYELSNRSNALLEILDVNNRSSTAKPLSIPNLKDWDMYRKMKLQHFTAGSQNHCRSLCSPCNMKDQSYGCISIDTVTVTDEVMSCRPECNCISGQRKNRPYTSDFYSCGIPNESASHSKSDSTANSLGKKNALIYSSCTPNTGAYGHINGTKLEEVEALLENSNVNILHLSCLNIGDMREWEPESPTGHFPDTESVSYSERSLDSFSASSGMEGNDGYPRINLDLDTIDSGFADSDCGSPVETEFGIQPQADLELTDSSSLELEQLEEYPRTYVKQWIAKSSDVSPVSANS